MSSRLLIHLSRLAGIAVCLFVALFAIDASDERPLLEVLPDFAIHLVPAAILIVIVVVAWRRPGVGAAGFGALAIGYAAAAPGHPDWMLMISGPLAFVAVLFGLSAMRNGQSTEGP